MSDAISFALIKEHLFRITSLIVIFRYRGPWARSLIWGTSVSHLKEDFIIYLNSDIIFYTTHWVKLVSGTFLMIDIKWLAEIDSVYDIFKGTRGYLMDNTVHLGSEKVSKNQWRIIFQFYLHLNKSEFHTIELHCAKFSSNWLCVFFF